MPEPMGRNMNYDALVNSLVNSNEPGALMAAAGLNKGHERSTAKR